MNKSLATLALAAVPALIFSACNGGSGAGSSGIAPLPNSQVMHAARGHHLDNGPQDLHAGGSTFAAYAYNLGNQPTGLYSQPQQPPGQGSLFYAAGTKGTIYYCLTGSGFGRKEFEANNGTATTACAPLGASPSGFGGRQDPLDFVGSDAAMASTECCVSGTTYYNGRLVGSVTWGQPFEFPVFGGPIVYGYRPADFKANVSDIKLSRWTYCAIANGTVSDWNDPAITEDNGKSVTGGTSQTVTFFFRSDSSGTTYIYTTDLNAQCNGVWKAPYNKPPYQSSGHSAAWTFGVNSTWPGPGSSGDPNPNFIGESGNPGVLAGVQSTPFSTGYLEGAWAASANPHVGQALLQNGFAKGVPTFVSPTSKRAVKKALAKITGASITYGGGSDGNPLGSTTPWCQLYIDPSKYDSPPKKTYPLVGPTYLLFYGQNNGVHLSDKQTLIKFLMSAAATKIVGKLEYSPFNSSVQTAVLNALNGSGSHSACLQ
ncbi:MAG: substrate-binding domain-containing protein [Candidatus Cybelea sp.]